MICQKQPLASSRVADASHCEANGKKRDPANRNNDPREADHVQNDDECASNWGVGNAYN
jgi:hypothetical protein